MEFRYQNYLVTLVLNPSDIIVRFEHEETFRIYEQTFYDRDFPIVSGLGGIEFVSKLINQALGFNPTLELNIPSFKDSPNSIDFTISYTPPFFVKPIELDFHLPALRKENGKTDMGMLNRKFKELSESIEPRVAELQSTMEKRLLALEGLVPLVQELQERCGNSITLPGCMFAIPTNLTSIILIKNQTTLPDGRAFSSLNPGHSVTGQYNNANISWPNLYYGYQAINYYFNPAPAPDSFVFTNLKNISNLKYLKDCKQVTLSGCNELTDYSPLGDMPWITHLTIVSSRQWIQAPPNNQWQWGNAGNNPAIKDISWIKNLKNLQSLTFLGCSSLSDITPLKDLPNLKTLDIRETMVRNTDFLINPNLTITK